MNLKCLFGFHTWYYDHSKEFPIRVCPKCRKHQTASYDMGYGETIWETSHNLNKPSEEQNA